MLEGWSSAIGEMTVTTNTGTFKTEGHFAVDDECLFLFNLEGDLCSAYAAETWVSVNVVPNG